ncbi:MXAN_2562 family outer membrane beta-barrel protein [Thermodesulfobacteriota bacterium]
MRMIFLTALIILTGAVLFPDPSACEEFPRWSVGLKGGQNEMQTENWDATYTDTMSFGGIEIGRKFFRQFGVVLGVSSTHSEAQAKTKTGRTSNDKVDTRLVPIDLSCVYRLDLVDDQIVVPYIAAGITHTFYQIQLNDDERSGDQTGYHVKGGIQLLLDRFDPSAAVDVEENWGLKNTYLFLEYYYSQVDDFGSESNDLGSKGIALGVIFEF